MSSSVPAPWATASLVLADGTIFWGRGLGAQGRAIGEICFNTSMTGYQEILTDPSYAGQIITFTFPHIGNIGANAEDIESDVSAARGLVLRADITEPSNFRAIQHLDLWLKSNNLIGIAGIDTRRLTRLIRDRGFQTAGIDHGTIDTYALAGDVAGWPGLEGMDLAKDVSCRQAYTWDQTGWVLGEGYGKQTNAKHRVVALDFGVKKNILRCLAGLGCHVTVVPASATMDEIMGHEPDGIFLSNGPGDPAATGDYAVPVIRKLVASGKPVFGICLGHQMLALALGAATKKMTNGHRGANHPIKNLETGKVEITSQNHGFVVDADSLPAGVTATHVSLFDGTLAGLKVERKPVFSVQYHPEASPGPQDSRYLFENFIAAMESDA
ncbi:MAG: glutamine-hydrolyzing carbamoyl-phosphate synthase small subunit [Alphaproteobacteria bacterium]|jgi:carbamoyl-phosphate synthase small subunit|nr:glutamine-hydrolyzing carbamoyl-phosphate synthase small subunit [Rhodospirillaceae bacterium]MBT6202794.1 glutamine-hydrolyzing carbamoyl-phosphate synthase small subunit [Rhodospirillaceae bacterium]MBT7612202.1 glutamine-hydrolyzing carbamoyl-phosphate synthase small subunit [Rhodospirillaceae bacterium]MBT7648148.1 glutamine-hydrolyzing carbamoyl-phosphate synthase small subunit [Rhodospirillaceae bacterium]MDG2481048.1 glutamine-hydrolyzing carbamoyl-phosphate synthase small subunit [Al